MKTFLALGLASIMAGGLLFAEPKPKSKKEVEALMAVQNAADPDGRIAAVENLLTKFADTEFKAWALSIAAESARQKNDTEKMMVYAERTLEADAKNFQAMIMIASALAGRTREFDLDKEEKLTKADKMAKDALEAIKTAAKPNSQITDEQWTQAKQDFSSDAYEALGLSALARKKFDDAAAQFKLSAESAVTPEGKVRASLRLAQSQNLSGKYDDALKTLEPILADQNLNPAFRQFAGQEKLKAVTGKSKK